YAIFEWSADCNGDGVIDYGQVFYADADGDGFGFGEPLAPGGCGVLNNEDCDDALALGFYTDADGDGFGVGEPDQPCGVTVAGDCNDADAAINPGAVEICDAGDVDENCNDLSDDADPGVADAGRTDFFVDADNDNYGVGSAVRFCDEPAFYALVAGDCNDSDPSVYPRAPELCDGIDQNCDGNADDIDGDGILDCVDVDVVMQVFDGGVVPGGTMIVRVSADTVDTIAPLLGLQTAIRFDASRLAVTSVTPVAGSPLPQEIIPAIVDNAAGTLLYAVGAVPGSDPLTGDADLFDIEFAVLPDADACAPGVVLAWFEPEASTFFVDGSGDALVPGLISLEATDLDVLPPVISGVPSALTVPTDAGTTFGAFIDEPSVTADDACTDSTLDISITYPGGSVVDAWPASGMFPQGTSTVLWTARDAGGNESTASWTITVEDYQLLDATIRIQGAFDDTQSSFSRCITISADGLGQSSQCVTFETLSKLGTVSGLVVSPAVEVFPCITAKDTPLCDSCECAGHSITDLGDVTIVGSRYSADFFLLQGNSNDDETIDVLDYGLWFIDFGDPGRCGRSNFNADDVVSSADFAWISINFFATGESCGGGDFNGAAPVTRISVKELRRRGLGELAEADVNGDGWLDMRDVQHVMQFGVPQPFSAE
ncbi:MAG: hypothetical protein RLZZ238_697, partial [Planctomycetota bacterium]